MKQDTLSTISNSRACLYGDGLFETIAFQDGKLQHWQDHWQRLKDGLDRLHYPNISEQDVLVQLTERLHTIDNQIVRLSISRTGQRGYRIPNDAHLLIDIQLSPFPTQRWDGKKFTVRWCKTRWARQPLLAGIKHLNRLEQILARSEWEDPIIQEGLVCDTEGYVISGTMSGVAWREDNCIFAPDLSQTGIASTSRKRFLANLSSQGYPIHIGYFTPKKLLLADTVWMMNAVQGVAEVERVINVIEH